MSPATVEITGIGPVLIKTDLKEIVLVGALSATGDFVNCRIKKVARDKRAAEEAEQVDGCYLKEISAGYFMLIDDDIAE